MSQHSKAFLGWVRRLDALRDWIIVCSDNDERDCIAKLQAVMSDADSGHFSRLCSGVVLPADHAPMPDEIPEAEPVDDDDTVICHRCKGTGLRKDRECRNCRGMGRLSWRNGNNT